MASDPVSTRDQADEPMSRAQHLLILEFGDCADFDNPRLEWRRLFSELLGTFLLVLAAAGGGILAAKGQIALGAAVVAPGLTVPAIILFICAVSGAHLNPAVSLAFALRGDFPWLRVPGYTAPAGDVTTLSFERPGKVATAFISSYAVHNQFLDKDVCHYQGHVVVNGA